MSKISTKLNLLALKHAAVIKHGKNMDVDCILIPIAMNHLFVGTKGVYLDLQGFETTPREGSKDTHLIKQSLPKEVFSVQTEEEKKAMPILGNHIVWGETQSQSTTGTGTSTTTASANDLGF